MKGRSRKLFKKMEGKEKDLIELYNNRIEGNV